MKSNPQRGGTFLGFIMGLVIGLGVSLAVAIYVTKVPTPFSSKNQPRSSEQDSAESQKNKDWNPNTVLQPKAPAEVPAAPGAEVAPKPADKVPAEVKPQLAQVRAEHPVLDKMVTMREELRQLWLSTSSSREQLAADLQAWCKRAEDSGVAALQEFSVRLRAARA